MVLKKNLNNKSSIIQIFKLATHRVVVMNAVARNNISLPAINCSFETRTTFRNTKTSTIAPFTLEHKSTYGIYVCVCPPGPNCPPIIHQLINVTVLLCSTLPSHLSYFTYFHSGHHTYIQTHYCGCHLVEHSCCERITVRTRQQQQRQQVEK